MPEDVIELRIKQLKDWLDSGYITYEQLLTILGVSDGNEEGLICARDLTPETCFLCEQEGNDYCMICADRFTLEEYKTIQKEG